jgi:hypothetical protein
MATPITLIALLAPVLMALWLWYRPTPDRLGFWLQSLAALSLIVAGWLATIWTVIPRWAMLVPLLLWLAATLKGARRQPASVKPQGVGAWMAAAFSLATLVLGSWATSEALLGQRPPPLASINLAMPLEGNDLAVANGGSTLLINAHQDTLDLSIPRHRLWQGQSYAADFVALRRFGFTANGLQPTSPAHYAIFGRSIKAPCTGRIVRLHDGRPDMFVPEVDPNVMEGNYVALRCGEYDVMMAHMKRGSIRVRVGENVAVGTIIGQVGNSGQSSEPHLHINAQTPGTDAAPFSGKPVVMRFNGRFLARNDRP